MSDRHTVDLQDRIDEIDDHLDEIEERDAEIEEKLDADDPLDSAVDDLGEDLDADTAEALLNELDLSPPTRADLEAEREALEEDYEMLAEARDIIADRIDAWGGSEFVFTELLWGRRTRINDRVRARAAEQGVGSEPAVRGIRKLVTVNIAYVETPPEAPDDANQYPAPVGEYLFEAVENYHDFGDIVGLEGNSETPSRLQQARNAND